VLLAALSHKVLNSCKDGDRPYSSQCNFSCEYLDHFTDSSFAWANYSYNPNGYSHFINEL